MHTHRYSHRNTNKKKSFIDYLDKDIKVSPSTSTTSNISSSSSSSGDSIATIEHPSYQSHRTIKATNNSNYYTSIEEEKYYPMISRKQSKSKSTPCNISTSPISPTAPISTITTPITPTSTTTSSSATAKNDSTVKRRRGNLPKEVTEFLRKWLIQHKKHPYPAEKEKADLARHTGLTVNQISNWFINARRRILQPMLESENLTAQMMNYPELVNHQQQSSASAFIEPPRRRRHDFYTYQRDFVSPTIEHQHQHHQSMHHLHLHEQQEYQHPHQHYYSDQQHQQEEHSSRFRRTRLIDTNDHYHQLSMR